MIKLSNVTRTYGKTIAVAPLSYSFAEGQTTALIGPSGCGKSTILRMIMGLIPPSSGSIDIAGVRLSIENLQSIRRKIGYVNQDGGLFPHLTAEQNVTIMARHIEMPATECADRLNEVCTLARFPQEGLDRYPSELSGGQKQRVGLMRALMLNPQILLMDEPLGALDPLVRAALQDDLRVIFAKLKKTVVFVTHDMGEAAYLSDHIVLLREGNIEQFGDVEDFTHRPATAFVTEFLNAQRGWGS